MEAARSFETSVSTHIASYTLNPEDQDLNIECHENLKSVL